MITSQFRSEVCIAQREANGASLLSISEGNEEKPSLFHEGFGILFYINTKERLSRKGHLRCCPSLAI